MFNDFMFRGKISNAIRVLRDEHKCSVLAPTNLIDGRPVLEILRDKHPGGQLHSEQTSNASLPTRSFRQNQCQALPKACNKDSWQYRAFKSRCR